MTQNQHPLLYQAKKAFNNNQLEQGLACIRELHKGPCNPTLASLELEALLLFRLQKTQAAAEALKRARGFAATAREKAVVDSELGNVWLALGEKETAINAFESSLLLDPAASSDRSRYLLMNLYAEQQQWQKFLPVAHRLSQSDRYAIAARMLLVEHARLQQDRALMLSCIEALKPELEQLSDRQLGGLIENLADLGDRTAAKQWLDVIAQRKNDPPWLNVYRAKLALSERRPQDAEALLQQHTLALLPSWLPLSGVLNLRAKSREQQQHYAEALQDFSNSAELSKEQAQSLERVDYVRAYQQLDLRKIPAVSLPVAANTPTFLLGFPRSGTTLLDTILDTHEHIISLSEKPALECVRRAFSSRLGKKYPQALTELREKDVTLLRESYFDVAGRYCDLSDLGPQSILLDKMPINTIHLPLIITLFPGAKLILALRHPLDVCLSNFQQHYKLNNEMAFLTTLADCVERYCQVYSLLQRYREELKLNLHVFRYEGLIDHPEKELRALCEFMRLEFRESLLDFDQHGGSRFINTPSREQVAKPLYRSSVGKWSHYADAMAPHQHKLARFIESFGYQPAGI